MDSKKRAVAISLIVLVILFAVWVSRSGIQTDRERLERVAMQDSGEEGSPSAVIKKEPAEQTPEETLGPAEEMVAPQEVAETVQPEEAAPTPPVSSSGPCATDSPAVAKKRTASAPEGMVYIPGGPFTMGASGDNQSTDDGPAHKVCVNGFYMDRFEVTNAQFQKFVETTGYVTDGEKQTDTSDLRTWHHPDGIDSTIEDKPNYPVVCISWNDANAYALWAGKRLPTEAEWEKAARGTDGRAFPWGNKSPAASNLNAADKSASFKWSSSSLDDKYKGVAPVGSFPSGKSVYGIEDMSGNVWEWCWDWWNPGYYKVSSANNPVGPAAGEYRVIRGGSWYYHLDGARTTQRMYFRPGGFSAAIGFRCVADVK
jgi:formylglycine-generating enzyme required for sulfatase activity